MKVLVAYATVTGNTEIIARAIASAIPGADLKKLPADVNPQDYDFIFAGFWCDKGTPDEVWQAFQKEAKAKPIAYFGTMGGDPNSERGQAWVNKVAGLFPLTVRELQGSSRLAGQDRSENPSRHGQDARR